MAQSEAVDAESQAKVIAKDPFVGNVSKLIPLPVDHKGPPMRGGSELHLLHQEHLDDLKLGRDL